MSFVHALFLLGGFAAAVPVLIHMSRSRKYKRVRIGTLRFLSSAIQERRRLKKIENWPLLLARIAILLLLASLFARPFLRHSELAPPDGAETLVLVDCSGSLAHPDAATRVDAILDRIRKDLAVDQTLTVVGFADVVQANDAPHAVAGAPTDFTAAIDWTIEHLAGSKNPAAAIHLITDLQQSPLPTTPPRLWPTGVKTEIHAVASPADYNIAIESVTLATPFKSEETRVEAVVRIFGTPPAREIAKKEVVLNLLDGKKLRVPLPAEGGRVRFNWKAGDVTELDGFISVESADPWPADNHRDFSFRLQQRKKVLLIDGDPDPSPFLGEAYFLQKALLASGAAHGQSPFVVTVRSGLGDLAGFDAVALCNVPTITNGEADALKKANAEGAGLIFILGDQSRSNSFQALHQRGLFPGFSVSEKTRMAPVTQWDGEQAALAALPVASLRSLILREAFSISPSADWTVLASFPDGQPLLLESAASATNRAPVMIFAHPVTREWGDFPLATAFVPLMREFFSHLTAYRAGSSDVLRATPGLAEERSLGIIRNEDGTTTIVSADVVEMNPETATLSAFRKSLGIPEGDPPVVKAEEGDLPAMAEHQRELWPWFLLGLFVLLMIENTLADRHLLTARESA